jgi:hypothetical protein
LPNLVGYRFLSYRVVGVNCEQGSCDKNRCDSFCVHLTASPAGFSWWL